MKKESKIIISILIIGVLSISFVSASVIGDVWNKITGNVVSSQLTLYSSSAPASVKIGDKFQIACNFASVNLPCVVASHGGRSSCSFSGFLNNGMTAVFDCTATKSGLQDNYCNLFDYIADTRCKVQQNKIQSTNVISSCTPNWVSGSWSTCSSGTQTRTVTDSNNCGVSTGKPATTQSCTVTTTDPCASKTCLQLGKNCGSVDNGCGTSISCGSCTSGQSCSNNICISPSDPCASKNCNDNNLCTDDSCSNGVCINAAKICPTGQSCSNGACVSPNDPCASINCDDANSCTTDLCSNGNCINTAITCATGESCSNGICVSLTDPCASINCDDANSCTDDSCSNGACINTIKICSTGQICSDGVCLNSVEDSVENNLGLKLVSSSVSKTSAKIGEKFQIKCDYGVPFLGCVQAKHGENNCTYLGYEGTVSAWECTANTAGTINNYCNLFDYPDEKRVSCKKQTVKINSTRVRQCSDCGGLFGIGCTASSCHSLEGCYYNPGFLTLGSSCIEMAEYCETKTSCEDFKSEECDDNNCGLSCNWNESEGECGRKIIENKFNPCGESLGLYDPSTSTFYLKNFGNGAENIFQFGTKYLTNNIYTWISGGNSYGTDPFYDYAKLIPLAGDWNGDGIDTIGLYDIETGTFYLKDSNSAGDADYVFQILDSESKPIIGFPITGDWDGDKMVSVGIATKARDQEAAIAIIVKNIYLKNVLKTGQADEIKIIDKNPKINVPIVYPLMLPHQQPYLAGDWDGNGIDEVALMFSKENTKYNIYTDLYATSIPYHEIPDYNLISIRKSAMRTGYLKDRYNSNGDGDNRWYMGPQVIYSVSGDFDGDKIEDVGVYDAISSTFYTTLMYNSQPQEISISYGSNFGATLTSNLDGYVDGWPIKNSFKYPIAGHWSSNCEGLSITEMDIPRKCVIDTDCNNGEVFCDSNMLNIPRCGKDGICYFEKIVATKPKDGSLLNCVYSDYMNHLVQPHDIPFCGDDGGIYRGEYILQRSTYNNGNMDNPRIMNKIKDCEIGCINGKCMECITSDDCSVGNVCIIGSCVDTTLTESKEKVCANYKDCDDGNLCTIDRCTDRICENPPITCKVNQICSNGFCNYPNPSDACLGVDCNDGNPCTEDSCSMGFCSNNYRYCPSGQICSHGKCIDTPGIMLVTNSLGKFMLNFDNAERIKWNQIHSINRARIKDGSLSLIGEGSGVTSSGKWKLSGDFDIQVNYDHRTFGYVNSLPTNAIILSGSFHNYTMKETKDPGNSKNGVLPHYYVRSSSDQPGWDNIDFGSGYGQFRITRKGNVIKAYTGGTGNGYEGGSGWGEYASISNGDTSDMIVSLKVYTDSTEPMEGTPMAYYDKFIINSGNVIQIVDTNHKFISSDLPYSINKGDTFQIKCDFGAVLGCVQAFHNGVACTWGNKWEGTAGVFNCVTDKTGVIENRCDLLDNPDIAGCVAQQNNIQNIIVR